MRITNSQEFLEQHHRRLKMQAEREKDPPQPQNPEQTQLLLNELQKLDYDQLKLQVEKMLAGQVKDRVLDLLRALSGVDIVALTACLDKEEQVLARLFLLMLKDDLERDLPVDRMRVESDYLPSLKNIDQIINQVLVNKPS